MRDFIKEITWRGMVHNKMPGIEEQLNKEITAAYLGIDPTADSLHIGHLVGVMMLKHFQNCGHKPIILVGGATGMIGDPSGKSKERNLLDEKTLRHNQYSIKNQLSKFLDFERNEENTAELVNNYDWMKDFSFLEFIRDVGKHITVNYMMAKDSVKKRLATDSKVGMSFTEFTYQLVQGYDFLWLNKNKNCKIQMGGSDQWGNITTGTELIRKKTNREAFAITCPLITKADGSKFGKTEGGNIWLDPKRTSPYKFYQFWLNTSDKDAERYIKIFTILEENEIHNLISEHNKEPHKRLIQRKLAQEVTTMIHSKDAYHMAVEASQILFGHATQETLHKLDENTLLSIFEGVPQFEVNKNKLDEGIGIISLLAEETKIFNSKGELRRSIKGNAISINKIKINNSEHLINSSSLIADKYILAQKGKKNYYLLICK